LYNFRVTKEAIIIPYHDLKRSTKLFEGKNIVLVGGCFDLLHYGHVQFLKSASGTGDFLIIALESDEFIKRNKRNIPIHNQRERAEILATLNMVDAVVLLPFFENEKEYYNLVEIIRPGTIAVTEGDQYLKEKQAQAEKVGAKVKMVTQLLKEFSTRKIISEF